MNKSAVDSEQFVADVEMYTRKCNQHLGRVALFRRIVLDQNVTQVVSSDVNLDELFDDGKQVHDRFRRSVTESHFLLLKANFEFYLFRTLCLLWDYHAWLILAELDDLPDGVHISKKQLFKMAVTGDRLKLPVGEAVVPVHGLDNLAGCFHNLTGADLKRIVQQAKRGSTEIEKEVSPWSQLHCAFEMRHLLEHRKGRVDKRFLDATKKEIKNSSWTDRYDIWKDAVADKKKHRVCMEDRDFDQTRFVMQASLPGIRDALLKRHEQLLEAYRPKG